MTSTTTTTTTITGFTCRYCGYDACHAQKKKNTTKNSDGETSNRSSNNHHNNNIFFNKNINNNNNNHHSSSSGSLTSMPLSSSLLPFSSSSSSSPQSSGPPTTTTTTTTPTPSNISGPTTTVASQFPLSSSPSSSQLLPSSSQLFVPPPPSQWTTTTPTTTLLEQRLQCHAQLSYWTQQWQALQQEHDQVRIVAALSRACRVNVDDRGSMAVAVWHALPREWQWHPTIVATLLQQASTLPRPLQWNTWPMNNNNNNNSTTTTNSPTTTTTGPSPPMITDLASLLLQHPNLILLYLNRPDQYEEESPFFTTTDDLHDDESDWYWSRLLSSWNEKEEDHKDDDDHRKDDDDHKDDDATAEHGAASASKPIHTTSSPIADIILSHHDHVLRALQKWPFRTLTQWWLAMASRSHRRQVLKHNPLLYATALLPCPQCAPSSASSSPRRWQCLDLFLTRVAPWLRDDATFMLSLFQTMAVSSQDHMGPHFLGPALASHRDLALVIADTALVIPSNALRCWAPQLRCHSVPVVTALCNRNGDNLLHTGSGLRRSHIKVITVACRQEPTAFRHVLPGPTRESLSRNPEFIRSLLQRVALKANATAALQILLPLIHPSLLLLLPTSSSSSSLLSSPTVSPSLTTQSSPPQSPLRPDPHWELALLVARAGWQALPEVWHTNHDLFWKQAITYHANASWSSSCLSWSDLPPQYLPNHNNSLSSSPPHSTKNNNNNNHHVPTTSTAHTTGGGGSGGGAVDGGELALFCLFHASQHCAYLLEPHVVPQLLYAHPQLLQTHSEWCLFPLLLYAKSLVGGGSSSSSYSYSSPTRRNSRPNSLSTTASSFTGPQDEFLSWALSQLPANWFRSTNNPALFQQALSIYPQCALEWMAPELFSYNNHNIREMIQTAIQVYGAATLEYLPPDVQRAHVDLVVLAIQSLRPRQKSWSTVSSSSSSSSTRIAEQSLQSEPDEPPPEEPRHRPNHNRRHEPQQPQQRRNRPRPAAAAENNDNRSLDDDHDSASHASSNSRSVGSRGGSNNRSLPNQGRRRGPQRRAPNHHNPAVGPMRQRHDDDHHQQPPHTRTMLSSASASSTATTTAPSLWSVYHWIPEDLWQNHRSVALAWVSVGGNYLHDEFSPQYDADAELFLAVASAAAERNAQSPSSYMIWLNNNNNNNNNNNQHHDHHEQDHNDPQQQQQQQQQQLQLPPNPPPPLFLPVPTNWCGDVVVYASESLLGDREFLRQAVRVNGHVLREARRGWNRDLELVTLALASTPNVLSSYQCHTPNGCDFDFVVTLTHHVRRRLAEHDEAYMQFVLGILVLAIKEEEEDKEEEEEETTEGIPCNDRGDHQKNHLGMLRVGNETMLAFQRLIAQYAGIPMGDELKMLRQASANLAAYGF